MYVIANGGTVTRQIYQSVYSNDVYCNETSVEIFQWRIRVGLPIAKLGNRYQIIISNALHILLCTDTVHDQLPEPKIVVFSHTHSKFDVSLFML